MTWWTHIIGGLHRNDCITAAKAEQVRAPVLVIQGRHDSRRPPRQLEVFEAKMKALGKSIAVHWRDAGHVVKPVESGPSNLQSTCCALPAAS
jgi:pimeloyl-ACP methyl ester carboxylesterase